jgi:hypothetical protein
MSDFSERPGFYLSEKQALGQGQSLKAAQYEKHSEQKELGMGFLKSLVLKELVRQMQVQLNDGAGFNKKYKLKSRRKNYGRKL